MNCQEGSEEKGLKDISKEKHEHVLTSQRPLLIQLCAVLALDEVTRSPDKQEITLLAFILDFYPRDLFSGKPIQPKEKGKTFILGKALVHSCHIPASSSRCPSEVKNGSYTPSVSYLGLQSFPNGFLYIQMIELNTLFSIFKPFDGSLSLEGPVQPTQFSSQMVFHSLSPPHSSTSPPAHSPLHITPWASTVLKCQLFPKLICLKSLFFERQITPFHPSTSTEN